MVNDSTKLGRGVVESLINAGIEHLVVSPGSRNAPISYAVAQAEAANLIHLHVRIDEREAGFLALGLAKASGKPAAVVVTSGSAVANLLPAILEAHYACIPLVAVTADRPAEVRGHGAPQTVNQVGIFGSNIRGACDISSADVEGGLHEVEHVLSVALGESGPVQINTQFSLPLMPDDTQWIPQTKFTSSQQAKDETGVDTSLTLPGKGLLIVGDVIHTELTRAFVRQIEELGWPIIWEPTANVHESPNALSHGPLILDSSNSPTPECVITLGAVGLSRSTLALLKSTRHIAVRTGRPDEPNPVLSAEVIVGLPVSINLSAAVETSWLELWKNIDGQICAKVNRALTGNELSGPSASLAVWNHAKPEDQLFVAASWTVRHVEAFADSRVGLHVFGNRGTNGIDGLISTAWGIATASAQRTYALMGDIAFLYGVGGLNVGASEHRPNLTIVVLDNDGSGIFGQLEQGADIYRDHFERVFGTPHDKDLWVIAEAFGVASSRVTTVAELNAALELTDRIPGVHVIVCATSSRSEERELVASIKRSVN